MKKNNLENLVVEKEKSKALKQRAYNVGLCPECGTPLVKQKYPEKKFLGIFYNEGQLLEEKYCPVSKSHCHTKIHLETC